MYIGSNWVNYQQLQDVNRPQVERQTQDLLAQLAGRAQAAQGGIAAAEAATPAGSAINFSPELRGQVQDATSGLNAAQGTYGLQALYQQNHQGQGYTAGMGLYDAALTGSAGGKQLAGLRDQYRSLFTGMEDAQARAATRGAGKGPQREAPVKDPGYDPEDDPNYPLPVRPMDRYREALRNRVAGRVQGRGRSPNDIAARAYGSNPIPITR